MRQDGELIVEYAAGAQTSHADRHAFAAIQIEARLRPINSGVVDNRLFRSKRQFQLLWQRMKAVEGRNEFFRRRSLFQLQRNRLGVAILDRYAIAMRGHAEWRVLNVIAA